jgi:hypothetical protein
MMEIKRVSKMEPPRVFHDFLFSLASIEVGRLARALPKWSDGVQVAISSDSHHW